MKYRTPEDYAASLDDFYRQPLLRYFNFFRLIIASLFLVVGRLLDLGGEAPGFFLLVTILYFACVLALGFPDVVRRFGVNRVIMLQVSIDMLVLGAIMWASSGYRSGMPVLMMVYLAAAGLVAEGKMGIFFAATASILVLLENVWRMYYGRYPADFLPLGISCIGFFAIAITARLLALRAKANASLAAQRGEALGRQQALNVRIIHDMQDGVIVVSAQKIIRYFNPRASELLGLPLSPGMHLQDIDENLLDKDALQRAQREETVQRLGPAGRLLRYRAVVPGEEDSGDTLIYLTDYDEIQKHMQQHKLVALGRLTASMAHELRNPLAALSQAAELLTEETQVAVQQRLIRIINNNARRIELMVHDILALGRRDTAMSEAVDLLPFVNDIADELSLSEDKKREIFAVNIAVDTVVMMDRAHLYQILGNLLVNARRYCSGRAGCIRIYTDRQDGWILIHIRDDGPGISEIDHLFEPFYTTDPKGTGLGLYIARELAEANSAALDYYAENNGAHFVLAVREY